MDFSKYDQSLQELHRQHQAYLQVADKRVMSVLRTMLHQALDLNDTELIGYVYHSMAFAEHFIMGRYQPFLKNLALSARYLLRCQDQSELMHVYYLVAIDSMNMGLNDISAYYFREARNIAEATGQNTSAAVLDQSIGHILLQLGQAKEARRYIKKSLQVVKKDKKHPHYFSNFTANYMNDVIACLELNLLEQAKKSFRTVTAFMEKHPNVFRSGTYLDYELLHLRLAVTEGDQKEAAVSFEKLVSLMKEDSMLHLYIEEIRKLISLLISRGQYAWIEEILAIIDDKGISPDAVDALKVMAGIKIDYYKASGQTEKLRDSYRELDSVYEMAAARQASSRVYINSLVQFTTNLRKEREELLARQNELINMREVDPLTQLPNRYSANIKLDEAFERAYHDKTKLGIVYLDVDGLKQTNDTKGHLAGDEWLVLLSRHLGEYAASHAFFASRFGGDEFVLIFENKEDGQIEAAMAAMKQNCPVPFSSGFYNAVPYGKQKSWDFLELADMELYKEKKQKKRQL